MLIVVHAVMEELWLLHLQQTVDPLARTLAWVITGVVVRLTELYPKIQFLISERRFGYSFD